MTWLRVMAVPCLAIAIAGWPLSPAVAADHDQPVVAKHPR